MSFCTCTNVEVIKIMADGVVKCQAKKLSIEAPPITCAHTHIDRHPYTMSTDQLAPKAQTVLKERPSNISFFVNFLLLHSMKTVSSWNNGVRTVTVPHGSCHPQQQEWDKQGSFFKQCIWVQVSEKISQMSLPLLLNGSSAPLSVLLLFVAFGLHRNDRQTHNASCKGCSAVMRAWHTSVLVWKFMFICATLANYN